MGPQGIRQGDVLELRIKITGKFRVRRAPHGSGAVGDLRYGTAVARCFKSFKGESRTVERKGRIRQKDGTCAHVLGGDVCARQRCCDGLLVWPNSDDVVGLVGQGKHLKERRAPCPASARIG